MATKRTDKIVSLRVRLKWFRNSREAMKEMADEVKEAQPEVLAALETIDKKGVGVVYDPDDKSKGAAYVQQNKGSEVWDSEAINEFIRKNKVRYLACTSRSLDIRKFEAEIANGNISAREAQALKITQPDLTPFIRFGKITKESL